MAKVVNITDKLELEGNPHLVIKDEELEVNADAATMLKIMGKYAEFDSEAATPKDILDLYNLMFPVESQKKIEKLKLSFTEPDNSSHGSTETDHRRGRHRGGTSDPYYDLIEDYDLIVSSFQSQYGLRLSREIHDMPWTEFRQLLIGLSSDTALGRIISIRSEDDKEILKSFTKEQHRIRNDWQKKRAKILAETMTKEEMADAMDKFKDAFLHMAGLG